MNIPISARIVALADVFDALSTRRCYKPAYEQAEVLSIIKEETGKYFDPACVTAFHAVYEKIHWHLVQNTN